jgi:hypothetical protein
LSAGADGKRVEKNEVEALPAAFRGGKSDFPADFDKTAPAPFFAVHRLPYAQTAPFFPASSHPHPRIQNLMKRYQAYITKNWRDLGLANVIVARIDDEGGVSAGFFLVDFFCLGVKDAWLLDDTDEGELEEMMERRFSESSMETMHPAWAKKFIEGAVAYAERIGFAPHRDFRKARRVLSGIDAGACTETFAYGHHGRPHYMQGQNDDEERVRRVLAVLDARCGPGGYYFTLVEDFLDKPDIADEGLAETRDALAEAFARRNERFSIHMLTGGLVAMLCRPDKFAFEDALLTWHEFVSDGEMDDDEADDDEMDNDEGRAPADDDEMDDDEGREPTDDDEMDDDGMDDDEDRELADDDEMDDDELDDDEDVVTPEETLLDLYWRQLEGFLEAEMEEKHPMLVYHSTKRDSDMEYARAMFEWAQGFMDLVKEYEDEWADALASPGLAQYWKTLQCWASPLEPGGILKWLETGDMSEDPGLPNLNDAVVAIYRALHG